MEKIKNPGIVIKRIRETYFYINDASVKPNLLFQSEINLIFGYALDANLIDFTVSTHYHPIDSQEKIAEITVQNMYEIPDLKQYLQNDIIKLPILLLSILVGMSITHTRALFAKNLAGTSLSDSIMPMVDAEDVARHFFPLMFEDEQTQTIKVKKSGKRRIIKK